VHLMSGRGKGRGGRGGRGGKSAPSSGSSVTPKAPPPPELTTPLQHWLKTLIKGSIDEQLPKLSDEVLVKTIKDFEQVVLQVLQQPKHTAYQKHAISMVLAIQSGTGFNPTQSRKIVCNMFSFLMDELSKYWMEYGLTKENVHQDYWKQDRPAVPDNQYSPESISLIEYENWAKAFLFLKS